MQTMIPLRQYVCDTCGEVIKSPKEGWLEWIHDRATKKKHSFRVCHHVSFSPLGKPQGCYRHGDKLGRADMHLDAVLEMRIPFLLSFLDCGKTSEPELADLAVTDIEEWIELVRRMTIPLYEEARQHWTKARNDGYFEGENELSMYREGFLGTLIEKYGTGS